MTIVKARARVSTPEARQVTTSVQANATQVVTTAVQSGIPGPPGPAGSGAALVHTQTTPAATWTIPHTFARQPVVQLIVDGALVLSDVAFPPGFVTVTHAQPVAGTAVLT